ncbi:MAG: SDR family oxidoreductase [Planctomycetota bacterium]|nr:SDR family oxidoreductase [Planctomycetota bacterium]
MSDFLSFEGQTALVTGGSRGIGAATVRLLCEQGAKVYFTYKGSQDAAHALEKELESAIAVHCDVTDQKQVSDMFRMVKKAEGKLHALVCAAGTIVKLPVAFTREQAFEEQFRVHLLGTAFCIQQAYRLMAGDRYGRIVAVSSVASDTGYGNRGAYAAAKGAVNSLVKTSAREFAQSGITVNAVLPGYTDTDMLADLDDKKREKSAKYVPMGRFAEPHEVANTIAFLASKRASYITGALLKVDGGLSM